MPYQLHYRRPETLPAEPFFWRDVRPAVWLQLVTLVLCLLSVGWTVLWFLAVAGYWAGVAIIAWRGIRPSVAGWDQIFVRWGFPALWFLLIVFLACLLPAVRW